VTGVIQAKNGNVWTVDGTNYTIDLLTVKGSANIGDYIELIVSVAKNEPAAQASSPSMTPPSGTPDPSATPPAKHDDKNEVKGVVTAITETTITIDGVVYSLNANSEFSKDLKVGDTVKVEFSTASDGRLLIEEAEMVKAPLPAGTETVKKHSDRHHDDQDEQGTPGMSEGDHNSVSQHEADEADDDDDDDDDDGSGGSENSGHD